MFHHKNASGCFSKFQSVAGDETPESTCFKPLFFKSISDLFSSSPYIVAYCLFQFPYKWFGYGNHCLFFLLHFLLCNIIILKKLPYLDDPLFRIMEDSNNCKTFLHPINVYSAIYMNVWIKVRKLSICAISHM